MDGLGRVLPRQIVVNAILVVWILVKLTLVTALLSPSIRELTYAGF